MNHQLPLSPFTHWVISHASALLVLSPSSLLGTEISSFLTLDSIWHKYFISLTRFNLSSHRLGMQELIPGCCSSLVSLPKDLETFISVIAKKKNCFFFVFFSVYSQNTTLQLSIFSLNISSHQMCGGGSHTKQFFNTS